MTSLRNLAISILRLAQQTDTARALRCPRRNSNVPFSCSGSS